MERRKVGIYNRKSLEKVNSNKAMFMELVNQHPNWEVVAEYEDISEKGGIQCDGVKLMFDDCRARKIDLVIIKQLSVFSRDSASAFEIIDELKANHVDLYAIKERIDTTDNSGWIRLESYRK